MTTKDLKRRRQRQAFLDFGIPIPIQSPNLSTLYLSITRKHVKLHTEDHFIERWGVEVGQIGWSFQR